jgi:cell division protein FtsB
MYGRASRTEPPEESAGPSPSASSRSFSRRRVAMLVGGLFALWLIGVFARQVGEASAAGAQADQLKARNTAISRDIQSLDRELALIKEPAFVAEMARGYLLGSPGEIPFVVDPNAEPLPADAPGSEGIQPAPPTRPATPLDSWLQAIFGPSQ